MSMSTSIKMVLSDGTPVADFVGGKENSTPIELSVFPSTPKGHASADIYMQAINYLFRGVSNFASGKLGYVSVEKPWFGRIEKSMDKLEWNAISDKSMIVVYELSLKEVAEHYYLAEGVRLKRGRAPEVKPVWNEGLIKPTAQTMKEGVITAIEIATEFTDEYRLVWGYNGKSGLYVLNSKDKRIDIDDIKNPEVYLLFRLLLLVASKERHIGVFCIDATGMSDELLNALVQASRTFYVDGFIFIKHLNHGSEIDREKLSLPVIPYV